MQQWCVDAGIVAKGSAEQTFEARNYYRCMCVHKECFDAFVQFRIDKITKEHSEMNNELFEKLKALRKSPNSDTLNQVLELESFSNLVQSMLKFEENTDAHFTVEYREDVSSMLTMVSAVREGHLRRHIEAERDMFSLTFAFSHQNYSRYCSFQHVLEKLQTENPMAYEDLTSRGFGGSISGQTFSAIHGDLITELFNMETKSAAGPFCSGFSRHCDR